MYPKGKAERLKREPRKEHWKPGDQNKYYDSVMVRNWLPSSEIADLM